MICWTFSRVHEPLEPTFDGFFCKFLCFCCFRPKMPLRLPREALKYSNKNKYLSRNCFFAVPRSRSSDEQLLCFFLVNLKARTHHRRNNPKISILNKFKWIANRWSSFSPRSSSLMAIYVCKARADHEWSCLFSEKSFFRILSGISCRPAVRACLRSDKSLQF